MIEEALSIAREVLVKPFEGYHRRTQDGGCRAYPDPGTGAEPWTIGYGSTGPDIGPNTEWTQQKALDDLDVHLRYFLVGVVKLSPNILSEPPRRLAALISFAYNCGLGNYRISTLRKRVNAKNWDGACTEIVKWNKAAGRVLAGLTRRRKAEAELLR